MIPSPLPVLLEATLRALVAALAVWAGLRLLRVRNVLAQKAAWGLVLIAALAMPLLMRWQWVPAWAAVKLPTALWANAMDTPRSSAPAAAGYVSASAEPATITQSVPEAQDPLPTPTAHADELHAAPITDFEAAPIPAPAVAPDSRSVAMNASKRLLALGWILYLGVCATFLSRLLWGLASSLRLWMQARPVATSSNLDLPASIPVRWSPRIASPVNIALGILLPADYAEWDEEKLRVVVAHEYSHIRQRDFYLQILAGLYASLTWFSPLGWWLKRKLSELGEAISDRAGLDAATSPSAYAELLLEFAALPRPTLSGVAMAHSTNLPQRIERLLNDASFRLAFAGGRRALLAVLVPATLIVATAMVRVQAAATPHQSDPAQIAKLSQDQASSQPAATVQSTGQASGQANPLPAQVSDSGPAQAPEAAPAPPPAPSAQAAPQAMPAPPAPRAPAADPQEPSPPMPAIPPIDVQVHIPPMPAMPEMHAFAFKMFCFGDGDSYALVGDPGTKTEFCGDWGPEGSAAVDKARSQAHGHFLLFRHDGKTYIDDDPATVSQIEAMDKQRQDLGDQMRQIGKQMRDAGQQEREAARKARETAANIPTPDLSKEIAALDATAASLKESQGGTISRQQLQEIQREISAIQSRVIRAEMGVDMKGFNIDMSKFGEEQGKYGAAMGKLGAQMGQAARESNEKIRSVIDESLKDGKARPVN